MDEFEYTKNIRDDYGHVLTVKVNKVGGGTVGRFYRREDWDIKIYNSSDELVWDSESKLHIGWTATHRDAAYEAVGWYEDSLGH
jgi:hypothetical protein